MPVALPEDETQALRRGLPSGLSAVPHSYLAVGRPLRVKSDPLCRLTGKPLRRKKTCRIVISVESIMRSGLKSLRMQLTFCVGTERHSLVFPVRLRVHIPGTQLVRLQKNYADARFLFSCSARSKPLVEASRKLAKRGNPK